MKLVAAAAVAAAYIGLGAASIARAEPWVKDYGLGTIFHPIRDPGPIPLPPCYDDGRHRCCPDRVHTFGINGFNPLCSGNFNGTLKFFRDRGFANTHFGQMTSTKAIAERIRGLRRTDPDARIVLVGFSLGANSVRSLANDLGAEGVRIDVLVYLGGDFVGNVPASTPPNVGRIVNLRARGIVLAGGDLFFNGADLDGAANHHLGCRHILSPTRKETLTLLMAELLTEACVPEEGADAPVPSAPPADPAPVLAPVVELP